MLKKSLATEFEKIDSNTIRKIIFGYSVLPALSVFAIMFFLNPSMAENSSGVIFVVMGVLALYAVSIIIIFGSLLGYLSIEVLKPSIREKVIQLTSHLLSTVLAHDKEIRKQVVQGIVSDISEEMKKTPDREVMEKMQLDMQTMNDSLSKIQEELKNRTKK